MDRVVTASRGSAYLRRVSLPARRLPPYIYRTDDYGKSWTLLTDGKNGIPSDWPTRVVREDPNREGLLYAGTEFGMFVSFDNGAHWQPFMLNMPNIPINDIKVHNKDLVVATQGRAIWILDNLSSLHQITPQTSTQAVTVYRPRDGYRTATGGAYLGPQIDYYLPTSPSDTVKIEILDATGKVVSSYKSGVAPPAVRQGRGGGGGDPGRSRGGDDGRTAGTWAMVSVVNVITKNAGFNRFTWGVQAASGLGAPPGAYQARVTVGDMSKTVPLNVKIDPRLAGEGLDGCGSQGTVRSQHEDAGARC